MEKSTPRGTRTGFTTGACAAAAARAAVVGLISGEVPTEIESLLPNGSRVRFAVQEGRCDAHSAHAVVVKFAGDDPDCTDGAHLTPTDRRAVSLRAVLNDYRPNLRGELLDGGNVDGVPAEVHRDNRLGARRQDLGNG